jgi:hypothetical protein
MSPRLTLMAYIETSGLIQTRLMMGSDSAHHENDLQAGMVVVGRRVATSLDVGANATLGPHVAGRRV